GAGLIGCEVAASARALGAEVTIVEIAGAPLQRVLGAAVGQACAELHLERGTQLRCGLGVASVDGSSAVESVTLTDGSRIAADVVLIAVGAQPNTEWLRGSGVRVEDGVVCDATLSAGDPYVFAAGDVARVTTETGATVRGEHWTNAVEQGRHVARALLVEPAQ